MLILGTHFSGIGAAEQALKQLGIPHVVKWACDIDKFAKQTYLANHSCEKWLDDIREINLDELEPVDLYVSGYDTSVSHSKRIYSTKGLGISLTANTGNKTGQYLQEGKIRMLTERECARLQGFPDSFVIPVSRTQAYR